MTNTQSLPFNYQISYHIPFKMDFKQSALVLHMKIKGIPFIWKRRCKGQIAFFHP